MFLIIFYMIFLLLIFYRNIAKKWIEWYHETGGVENKFKCGSSRITAEEDKAIVYCIKQNNKVYRSTISLYSSKYYA